MELPLMLLRGTGAYHPEEQTECSCSQRQKDLCLLTDTKREEGGSYSVSPPKRKASIPGTVIFDGKMAIKGYALNKMCLSFNSAANREEFLRDEDAYCDRFQLSDEQRRAVKNRNVLELLEAGGNIYYLAKLAGIFGLDVQDIGAQQTGMTVEAFKAKLRAEKE